MKDKSTTGNEQSDFGKKVLANVQQVKPYVKHRLYTAETSGIIPRNMYKSNGIIDDAIIKLHENAEVKLMDDQEIKLKLFYLVNERLDELFKKEEFHKYTLDTTQILKEELEKLEEKFEMDLDWDLLMSDELDDISYHQEDRQQPSFRYEDAEENIIQTLEIYDSRRDLTENKRIALNKVYSWLPFETSNILDLLVFGKLTYEEIASIKNIDVAEIKNIIATISLGFRKNLN